MSYTLFATIVTIGFAIYFVVNMYLDLFGKGKVKKKVVEEIGVADMFDDDSQDIKEEDYTPAPANAAQQDPSAATGQGGQQNGAGSDEGRADGATSQSDEDHSTSPFELKTYASLQRLQEEGSDTVSPEYDKEFSSEAYLQYATTDLTSLQGMNMEINTI